MNRFALHTSKLFAILLLAALCVPAPFAQAYSIPEDQLDTTKVYAGSAKDFDKAGAVDMDTVIKATPEYGEIKKNKIQRGTGEYWILLNKASERALRAILDVHQETDYDFVAAKGYLDGLKPPIPADDITEQVVDKIVEG